MPTKTVIKSSKSSKTSANIPSTRTVQLRNAAIAKRSKKYSVNTQNQTSSRRTKKVIPSTVIKDSQGSQAWISPVANNEIYYTLSNNNNFTPSHIHSPSHPPSLPIRKKTNHVYSIVGSPSQYSNSNNNNNINIQPIYEEYHHSINSSNTSNSSNFRNKKPKSLKKLTKKKSKLRKVLSSISKSIKQCFGSRCKKPTTNSNNVTNA